MVGGGCCISDEDDEAGSKQGARCEPAEGRGTMIEISPAIPAMWQLAHGLFSFIHPHCTTSLHTRHLYIESRIQHGRTTRIIT